MNYYKKIKNELINNEVYKKVKNYSKNRSDLNTYYKVGKLLNDAGKSYGEGIIKKYSDMLTKELGKGYTFSALSRMKQFFNISNKLATVSQLLSWSHYVELLSLNDINKINYYIKITEEQNLSVRKLRKRIKSREYERLDDKTKEALYYREKYKEASLKELSEIIEKETGRSISKSGLNHRFRKIKELASKFMEQ